MGLKGFFWVAVRCRPATLKAMTYFRRSSASLASAGGRAVMSERPRERAHRKRAGSSTGGLAKEVGSKGKAIGKTLEEGARLEQVYCAPPPNAARKDQATTNDTPYFMNE
jgi:hypothetical protein